MSTQPISDLRTEVEPETSWLPIIVIALAQILMILNVSTLQAITVN
jgi:hypothetical protein